MRVVEENRFMAEQWYISLRGRESRPLSAEELQQIATAGRIEPETLVRKGKQGQWVRAGDVRGLNFVGLAGGSGPPPLPPQTAAATNAPVGPAAGAKQRSAPRTWAARWAIGVGVAIGAAAMLWVALLCRSGGQHDVEPESNRRSAGTGTAGTSKEPRSPSGRWALLIGVDEYLHATPLRYCGADVRALKDRLVANGFPANQVFLLDDKAQQNKYKPFKSNIERELAQVLSLLEQNDLLLLGFSGHGVHFDGRSYLCPEDATLEDPRSLISLDDVHEQLNRCRARMKLMLVDACRNDPRPAGRRGAMRDTGMRAFLETGPPPGILRLNSCAEGQFSMEETDFGHGVFMHFVLEGLAGKADADGNGRVSLIELYGYANQQTKLYVHERFHESQTPALKGDIADNFDIAVLPRDKVSAGASSAAASPPARATLAVYFVSPGPKRASQLSLPSATAPEVRFVIPGGAGNRMGLMPGDVLLDINGSSVADINGLGATLKSVGMGSPLRVTVFRAGRRVVLQGDYETRLSEAQELAEVRRLAEKDNPDAQCWLAGMYLRGTGTAIDEAAALTWYRKAADRGHAKAQYDLSYMYAYGKGMTKNPEEAYRWCRQAAEQDYVPAQITLGSMHLAGQGVAPDGQEAARWYRKAADLGSEDAKKRLAALATIGGNGSANKPVADAADPRRPAPLVLSTAIAKPAAKPAQGTHGKTTTNLIGMKLVLVPAGEFLMGSSPEEIKAWNEWFQKKALKNSTANDEGPQHRVRISRPFYLGAYEVTRGQFRRFVEESGYRTAAERDGKGGEGLDGDQFGQKPQYTWRNTGFEQTDEHPVVNVNWNDAVAFCQWLSRKEGKQYRLPTEAEWEYACRAGTTTRYWHGDETERVIAVGNVGDETAKARFPKWPSDNEGRDGYVFTAPVGQFRPNPFGLYDMHGNVCEWCADWRDRAYYRHSPVADPKGPDSGVARVHRGGSWRSYVHACRSSYRGLRNPEGCNCTLGFRVAQAAAE